MYTHLQTVGELLRAKRKRPGNWRRDLRLWLVGVSQIALYFPVSAARYCDRIFWPGYRTEPLPAPLFIVATPRSGTTFLHHVLAADVKTFTHLRLFQTIFRSILCQRLITLAAEMDALFYHPVQKVLRFLGKGFFSEWQGIHAVGLNRQEEDEALFVQALSSPALYLLYPFIRDLPWLKDIDKERPELIAPLAAEYRETVQRQSYIFSSQREQKAGKGSQVNSSIAPIQLIKNVLLPSRLEVAQQAFPDARWIHIVRDPRRAIPSAVSLFFASWQQHSPEIAPNSPEVKELAQMFIEHYKKLHAFSREQPKDRVLTIRFEDLIQNPEALTKKIYSFLGVPFSKEAQRTLVDSLQQSDDFKSTHRYTLEQFGLQEAEVLQSLEEEARYYGYID
ncbi:MAG: sulfotransferase [Polyangiaceae bacterium]|nr:sulfotransferase [Polyangiaceae bacterium]